MPGSGDELFGGAPYSLLSKMGATWLYGPLDLPWDTLCKRRFCSSNGMVGALAPRMSFLGGS